MFGLTSFHAWHGYWLVWGEKGRFKNAPNKFRMTIMQSILRKIYYEFEIWYFFRPTCRCWCCRWMVVVLLKNKWTKKARRTSETWSFCGRLRLLFVRSLVAGLCVCVHCVHFAYYTLFVYISFRMCSHCWPNGNAIPTNLAFEFERRGEGPPILNSCTHIDTCVVYDERQRQPRRRRSTNDVNSQNSE